MAAIVDIAKLRANKGARPRAESVHFLKAGKVAQGSGCFMSLLFFLNDVQDWELVTALEGVTITLKQSKSLGSDQKSWCTIYLHAGSS